MPKNICDICGANLAYRDGRWFCPACGAVRSKDINGEEDSLLFNAAQKLRLAAFDEAEEMYRDIVAKYPNNSAARWGLVLAKYGIKYETDFDGKLVPTCYATNIASVQSDSDYRRAIDACADKETKQFYREQGEVIERIRNEWLACADKLPVYDVFLCFKDSDKERGIDRTDDSYEVSDLYAHLTKLGYNVFFSRECLRDKVAKNYEPYIYNAVNTAKAMIVYGGQADYFNSTWMRNEWTRFLRRMREGDKGAKSLVVVCDGVSPDQLPTPLDKMQVLDATQKTFYADLVSHLAEVCGKNKAVATKAAKPQADETKSDWESFNKHYADQLEAIAESLEISDIKKAENSLRLLETVPQFVQLCKKSDKKTKSFLVKLAQKQKHNYVKYFSQTDGNGRLTKLGELLKKQPCLNDYLSLFKQLDTVELSDLIVLKKFATLQEVYGNIEKQRDAVQKMLDKWGK